MVALVTNTTLTLVLAIHENHVVAHLSSDVFVTSYVQLSSASKTVLCRSVTREFGRVI